MLRFEDYHRISACKVVKLIFFLTIFSANVLLKIANFEKNRVLSKCEWQFFFIWF